MPLPILNSPGPPTFHTQHEPYNVGGGAQAPCSQGLGPGWDGRDLCEALPFPSSTRLPAAVPIHTPTPTATSEEGRCLLRRCPVPKIVFGTWEMLRTYKKEWHVFPEWTQVASASTCQLSERPSPLIHVNCLP